MNTKAANVINKESLEFPYIDKPVELYTLDNGHTVVIARKSGELVNVSTWVKTGSINEDDSITGISHFLEHLMFKGTEKYPAGYFDRVLEAKGAVVNAATWKDYTFYYVTLPRGENDENFKLAVDLHADMMINPSLPEAEIGPPFDFNKAEAEEKRERCVVIEEIRMRDDSHWTTTYDAVNNLMYKDHPYKRDVIGTAEVIASVSRETIMDYYKSWYTPKNMITIIVGDVNPEDTLELVREKFAYPEDRTGKKLEYSIEQEQTEERFVEKSRKDINTGFLILGYHGPRPAELKENISMDVLSIVLGEGKSSRLYQNLIEKQDEQLFNVVGSTQYEFKEGNVFLVQANFIPDRKDRAIELLKQELLKVTEEKISLDELNKAKKKLKSGFAEETETVSEIGELIGHCMTVYGNLDSHINYLNVLEKLTVDDVLQVAKKYLAPDKVSASILIPEA